MSSRFRLPRVAPSVLFLLLAAGAASAQVVVLASRGPSAGSFPQGSVLPATRVINLKPGDHLELLDSAGSHVVNGPASVVAGHVDGGSKARLMEIFLKGQQARPGIAATRGFELQPASAVDDHTSLWQADISEGGAACVLKGQKPSFARADSDSPIPRRIVRTATGEDRAVDWPLGSLAAEWPADLPVADGESYTINLDDGSTTVLTWRTLTPSSAGVEALASDLLAKGCYAQLDKLRAATVLQ